MKVCTNCHSVKPDTDFYPDHREYYRHQCKSCLQESFRDYHYRNTLRTPEEVKTPAVKVCSRCRKALPITDYYKDRGKADGHRTRCKGCFRSSSV